MNELIECDKKRINARCRQSVYCSSVTDSVPTQFQQRFVFFVLYMLCRPFNVYISSFYCFVKGVILISSPLLSILLSIQGIDLMMKQLIHFIINNSVWNIC